MAKRNGATMIKSSIAMYLEMFEKTRILSELIQERTRLQKNKSIVHKCIYNNTTDIKKLEEELIPIIAKLKNKIGV